MLYEKRRADTRIITRLSRFLPDTPRTCLAVVHRGGPEDDFGGECPRRVMNPPFLRLFYESVPASVMRAFPQAPEEKRLLEDQSTD
jgi:hypothetical protein